MFNTTLDLGARSRLLIHKFDPETPAPGGIDTCIRGIIKYSDPDESLAIVGVEGGPSGRRALGTWRPVELYGRRFQFMAVAPLDPGNQVRRLPHSLRIGAGLVRYKGQLPKAAYVQTHRADLGLLASTILSGRHDYFIHTQESGILGSESDSFWKRAAPVHRSVEKTVVKRAHRVRVFNPTYAERVKEWNSATMASPTWWDPELIPERRTDSPRGRNLLWVGRLEQPKVPSLALAALSRLTEAEPTAGWKLRMVGAGNLETELRRIAKQMGVSEHVEFVGRLNPHEVMDEMARASILLMTSVAGYEGFPRVLVEGLANGLSAVVTEGADTGSLVADGVNGYRVTPDASEFASRISQALALSATDSRRSVEHLSAPRVVRALYER
ncbi:glycosyltransferase [Microbacterium radiodurans]|uniref:Glycosyltransferase n=1 Tax=Microbacterium radiodurans TaxID=661398 RepID=A0A5J5IN62_9MICO|nr:glycosyltransferase [Microbacterium radiodurans]KAA9084154.1 glycosyltransferase [Microbacterium radiodurans]